MGDIVNLRGVRKAKAREVAAAIADANRAAFGRSKAERDAATSEKERQTRTLAGAKREP